MQQPQAVIAVVGPTAAGKTSLAVQLAQQVDGEIINADSMQFYRGMDIGTAKATPEERQGVPHHLMDTLSVTEEASVAQYQLQARELIADIRSRHRVPILVGGSGLYIRAVLDRIEFPPTDSQVRQRLSAELQVNGEESMRKRLREVDPDSEATVKDQRRLIRALEVNEISGRPFTSFMPQRVYETSIEPVVQLGVDLERTLLHQRIAQRVEIMHAQGLLEEVRELVDQGLREGKTASRAIGYQQYLQLLDGEITAEAAIEDTTVATRQLARRQLTWFRADPRIHWLDAQSPELLTEAQSAVCS